MKKILLQHLPLQFSSPVLQPNPDLPVQGESLTENKKARNGEESSFNSFNSLEKEAAPDKDLCYQFSFFRGGVDCMKSWRKNRELENKNIQEASF